MSLKAKVTFTHMFVEWFPQQAYGSEWILSLYPTDAYGAKSIFDSLAVEILSFTSTA